MTSADNLVEVGRAGLDDAELLGLTPGSPLLRVVGITRSQADQAVEYSDVLYRPDSSGFIDPQHCPCPAPALTGGEMANEVSLPSDFADGGQLFVRNATGLVREFRHVRWQHAAARIAA